VQIFLSILFIVICAHAHEINNRMKSTDSSNLSSTSPTGQNRQYPKFLYILDYLSVVLVLVVIVINTFISAFGLDLSQKSPT